MTPLTTMGDAEEKRNLKESASLSWDSGAGAREEGDRHGYLHAFVRTGPSRWETRAGTRGGVKQLSDVTCGGVKQDALCFGKGKREQAPAQRAEVMPVYWIPVWVAMPRTPRKH